MPDLSKSKFHTQGYTIASTLADASGYKKKPKKSKK